MPQENYAAIVKRANAEEGASREASE